MEDNARTTAISASRPTSTDSSRLFLQRRHVQSLRQRLVETLFTVTSGTAEQEYLDNEDEQEDETNAHGPVPSPSSRRDLQDAASVFTERQRVAVAPRVHTPGVC